MHFLTTARRLVLGFALAGAALGGALLSFSVPAAAAPVYDGKWSVLIITQKGECDRGYRYPVQISNGNVGYAGEASFTVSGRVNPSGAISVTVSRGSQSAHGTGRLSGNNGSGAWQAGTCAGTWTAERRS